MADATIGGVADCGHRCCRIRANAYHVHPRSPERCQPCRAAAAREPEPRTPVVTVEDLALVVESVLTRVAPEVPGLPTGATLTELVSASALDHWVAALDDPDLIGTDRRERRRILAGRVGVALAFPDARPGTGSRAR